ncbi:High-affinity branched-chain amino acid transport ATP-binding protein LivF [Caulifigura coniformis]|uniref:High-affinity branched-chain amino acid transport ATP-binding protein LivF n=1 Tax=Caulifigura coniformis TaxID=2527983 RepID=A0A517SGS0_9PLAN|nr:ABC transporter ATP-binding protein [Caulifigura coniformis]QDT55323.1 High-affinity branched-chain amino acid transport ATP-binding protein LivF [Caulifigura coniformis]
MTTETPLLAVKDLEVGYGAIQALRGISLEVRQGEIVTLIGANGAGKTTTLRAISGMLRPRSGQVSYDGRSVIGVRPHLMVGRRLIHVPEGRGIFLNLTVEENLRLGAYTRTDDYTDDLNRVYELFPRVKERLKQTAGTMSGGEQQMLAIGRALLARPRLLLLDEPSLGLAPKIVQTIFSVIREINQSGTTILLIEQNARMALQSAHRAYVLEAGKIIMDGDARELVASDEVRKAYLGAH